jgi:polysaccharide biosynthesis protein PslH
VDFPAELSPVNQTVGIFQTINFAGEYACSSVRILLLTNIVPYPPHGGVHLRVFHLLKRIAEKHEVVLGCHAWCEQEAESAAELSRMGIRTVTGMLHVGNWRHAWPAIGAAMTGRPPEIVQYQTSELHALVREEHFDIVQVEETLLAPYADSIPKGAKTKTVLTFHNVHFVQARRIAGIESGAGKSLWANINALFMRRYEPSVAGKFDRSIAVSEVDRKLLLGSDAELNVSVIPNGVDTRELKPLPQPKTRRAIVFVGTLCYRPCIDAAVWLVRKILPLLREQVPDIEVWIVGKGATAEVEALAGENVFVTGWVPDTQSYYQRAAVAVAPLRAGGGSRLKILEAMALGRPVVSTTVGAEGIDVVDGETILIADDAAGFARAIAVALNEPTIWEPLVRNARRFVEERHDWEAIADRQLQIYEELAQ